MSKIIWHNILNLYENSSCSLHPFHVFIQWRAWHWLNRAHSCSMRPVCWLIASCLQPSHSGITTHLELLLGEEEYGKWLLIRICQSQKIILFLLLPRKMIEQYPWRIHVWILYLIWMNNWNIIISGMQMLRNLMDITLDFHVVIKERIGNLTFDAF